MAGRACPPVVGIEQFFKNRGYTTLGGGRLYHSQAPPWTTTSQVEPESWDFYYPSPYLAHPYQMRLPDHAPGRNNCRCRGETRGPGNPYIWEAMAYDSGRQMGYLPRFFLSEGRRYQDLLLASDDLQPRVTNDATDLMLDGWAFMMRTPDRRLAMLYFENACEIAGIRRAMGEGISNGRAPARRSPRHLTLT